MLVLSRKPGEKIQIGDDVTITLIEVNGDRIRLGIEAPKAIPIWRGELAAAMEAGASAPATAGS